MWAARNYVREIRTALSVIRFGGILTPIRWQAIFLVT